MILTNGLQMISNIHIECCASMEVPVDLSIHMISSSLCSPSIHSTDTQTPECLRVRTNGPLWQYLLPAVPLDCQTTRIMAVEKQDVLE
jgi:hypothetical protein